MMLKNSPRLMNFMMALLAISVGALVNYLGDRLLGVRLELFWGVSTFSPIWVLDLFLVPFIAGLAVSAVYGLGGKLLCYFSPLIVRVISYVQMNGMESQLPDGVTVLPFFYWILVLIVAIEAAAFGGIAGEVMIKRIYGRRPKHLLYKRAVKNNHPSKIES